MQHSSQEVKVRDMRPWEGWVKEKLKTSPSGLTWWLYDREAHNRYWPRGNRWIICTVVRGQKNHPWGDSEEIWSIENVARQIPNSFIPWETQDTFLVLLDCRARWYHDWKPQLFAPRHLRNITGPLVGPPAIWLFRKEVVRQCSHHGTMLGTPPLSRNLSQDSS